MSHMFSSVILDTPYLGADQTRLNPAHDPYRLRTAAILLAIIAGQAQNVLQSYIPNVGAITYVDDALFAIAFVLSLQFVGKLPATVSLAVLSWVSLCVIALGLTMLFSETPTDVAFTLFRQIVIPALLIVVGMTLRGNEWLIIGKIVIVLALINAVYIGIEFAGIRLVDPAILGRVNSYSIYDDGLPGTYHGNNFITGERITRAGGLLLNPPTMSLFLGVAVVISNKLCVGWFRWAALLSLGLALFATNGRGGILVALIGIGAPMLYRWIGPWGTLIVISICGWIIGSQVLGHGGSIKHLSGLTTGVEHATSNPFGRGFGYVGNATASFLTEEAEGAESLLGIAFSAIGLAAVGLTVAAILGFTHAMRNPERAYLASIGLGGITAALFVESASALNGTVPLWLAAGLAIGPTVTGNHRYLSPNNAAAWSLADPSDRTPQS